MTPIVTVKTLKQMEKVNESPAKGLSFCSSSRADEVASRSEGICSKQQHSIWGSGMNRCED
jgi:hypothetical protein